MSTPTIDGAALGALEERLKILNAMLVNTIDAADGAGFTSMHYEHQQAYLLHCGELASEAASLAGRIVKRPDKRLKAA